MNKLKKEFRNEKLDDLLKRRKKEGLDLNDELTHLINFGAALGERSLQLKKIQFNFSVVVWSGIIVAFAFLFPYRKSLVYDPSVAWLLGLTILLGHFLILLLLQIDISNDLRRYQRITMKVELLLRVNGFDPRQANEISKDVAGLGALLMMAGQLMISGILLFMGKTLLQLP